MESGHVVSQESTEDLREACGVFGCVATGKWPTDLDVTQIIYLGMIGLQHRGQESYGIATSFGDKNVKVHKRDGLVGHSFKEEDLIRLKGNLGIGHTRYSTTGGTDALNTQPFIVHTMHGALSLAHNGELLNASKLRQEILGKGIGLSTESDSELMVQILCLPPSSPDNESNGPNWPARIKNLMQKTPISYSLLIMNGDKIYAVRDPFGNRPLCLGKLSVLSGSLMSEMLDTRNGDKNGNVLNLEKELIEAYVVSSESCAFSSFGGKFLREVKPGEIVEISKNGIETVAMVPRPGDRKPAFCIFEYVYFSRPDSIIEGQAVYAVRQECGRQLARQSPIVADIVSAVPESGTPAALGFSEESKIPYAEILCKNRYIGRTFIQPTRHLRQLAVLKKFGPLTANVKGKRIVLIDDSIVRGTTIGVIINLLRDAGASEVHLRIASPPVRNPCYMGINIPTKEELIANNLNPEELAKKIGADSLVYLNVDNLLSAVRKNAQSNGTPVGHCTACLTGEYPVELDW